LTTRRVPVLCTRSLPMSCRFLLSVIRPPPRSPLFPYPTLFRSAGPRRLILEPIAANVVALLLRLESPDRRRVVAYIGERALRPRSEEHTSELQSRENLVCRLLLEKKMRRVDSRTARKELEARIG